MTPPDSADHAGSAVLSPGDIVRFKEPQSVDEESERFAVIELRGDRVLVEFICDMRLKPTFSYWARDLVKA